MIQSGILLSITCCMVLVITLLIYFTFNETLTKSSANKSLLSWRELITLVLFIGSSVCYQWITSVTCRPVHLIYDQRYTFMLIVQILGFITGLHYAYGSGNIIKPAFDKSKTSPRLNVSILSKFDDRVPLLSSINIVP